MPSSVPLFNYADMRHVGTLQNDVPIVDDAAGETSAYADVVTTRVAIVKKSGRLVNADGRIVFVKTCDIYCREQAAIVLNVSSRWKVGSDIYKIVDFELVDDIPHIYHFICTRENG